MHILIINGPNLNLLGTREPAVYGTTTLPELEVEWQQHAAARNATVDAFQSNHEGAIVDVINDAIGRYDAMIINAGALTHYSFSLRDAVAASGLPTVEVHISNIYEREEWRHFSVLSDVCELTIVGRGTDGYVNAIDHVLAAAEHPPTIEFYGDHSDAVIDVRTPAGDGLHPVILLIHGGFWGEVWKRDVMDPMAVALAKHGWATVNAEYTRGMGSYATAPDDIASAVHWIRDNAERFQLDPDHIVAVGHSAGGYLALGLAHSDSAIFAAVPLAAVSDLVQMSSIRPDDDPVAIFLGSPRDQAPRLWEQAELAGTPTVPVHMIHGASDDTVPLAQSEAYAQLKNGTASITTIENCEHMDIIDPTSGSWRSVAEVLETFMT
jgi:3-dehydroquinate dehydratase-2